MASRLGTAAYRSTLPGLALVVLAALAGAPAGAEVFRCDENGKVVYSDRACGKEPKSVFGRKTKAPHAETSSSAAAAKTSAQSANVESPTDGRLQPVLTREASERLTRCVAENFNRWYLAEEPKPARETAQARLKSFDHSCRKQLDLPAEARSR